MPRLDTQENINALLACGPLKAWSVIVTILGDLCVTRDDRVSGRLLLDIVTQMGIADQTMRVALHRLRKDGWVVSYKRGRDADYALSDNGWQETEAVRDRIYSRTAPEQKDVVLAIAPPELSGADFQKTLPSHAVQIAPRTAVLESAVENEELWYLPLPGCNLPPWAKSALADDTLRKEYGALHDAANQVMGQAVPSDPIQALALRLLTLHHWRRLRLRHGDLADHLLGPDWVGHRAREVVMDVLEHIGRDMDRT
jgi:phenylacetic acid degradation operon negative regulatory protein